MTTIHDERCAESPVLEADSQPLRGDGCLQQDSPIVHYAVPNSWDGRLAYVVSQVGSPPVLGAVAMGLIATTLSSPRAWTWAGVYVTLSILVPLAYLVWLLHNGRVTDLDVQIREQRSRPFIFTIACAGLTWLAMAVGGAPPQMIMLTGALGLQMVIIFGITLRWKISVHSAAAAGVGTLVWSLVGATWPLLVGVPIIAWSRVRLHRHTVAQTVAGAALGFTIFLVALSMTC